MVARANLRGIEEIALQISYGPFHDRAKCIEIIQARKPMAEQRHIFGAFRFPWEPSLYDNEASVTDISFLAVTDMAGAEPGLDKENGAPACH
jgi:hypothetical protein